VLFDPRSKEYVGSEEVKARIVRGALDMDRRTAAAANSTPTELLKVPVGGQFVDPNGTPRTMTKELKAALEKQISGAPGGATGGF
jgi:hypothetical protein